MSNDFPLFVQPQFCVSKIHMAFRLSIMFYAAMRTFKTKLNQSDRHLQRWQFVISYSIRTETVYEKFIILPLIILKWHEVRKCKSNVRCQSKKEFLHTESVQMMWARIGVITFQIFKYLN